MKKEEKTEITKCKILAAAIQEFGANGYAAGSVNNICKTGINKGLIYHNYKDKDELYLVCVQKSCEDLIGFVINHQAETGFVNYMNARRNFLQENEAEANLFLEARTNPPRHLTERIREIYQKFDALNLEIFEKELSNYELRPEITREDALHYFNEIQRIYNLSFASELQSKLSPHEQLTLHETNIQKLFDFILYGIAKRGEEI